MNQQTANTTKNLDPIDLLPPGPIPIQAIIEYRQRGLSINEIGKLLGCTKQNISARLKPVIAELNHLNSYKKNKADVIDFKASQILNGLTIDKIKEASGYQLTGMFGILNQHSRLERGESTSNMAVLMDAVGTLQDHAKQAKVDDEEQVHPLLEADNV